MRFPIRLILEYNRSRIREPRSAQFPPTVLVRDLAQPGRHVLRVHGAALLTTRSYGTALLITRSNGGLRGATEDYEEPYLHRERDVYTNYCVYCVYCVYLVHRVVYCVYRVHRGVYCVYCRTCIRTH